MPMRERMAAALRVGGESVATDLFWYVAAASAVWATFYLLFRRRLAGRKIIHRAPSGRQVSREVLHSLRSILVFAAVAAAIGFIGRDRLYWRVEEYPRAWLVASFILALFAHDAYFYWTHRLMHHERLYRFFHRAHHLSNNPTPWAAYAFSVPEALVQAGIGPLIVYAIPMHGMVFAAFMSFQIGFNVVGHSGYEVFPRWFLGTWAGRLLNTPTHHALHHEKFLGNYGLYFNVWDRMMGTNRPDYEARFRRAAGDPGALGSAGGAGAAEEIRSGPIRECPRPE